MRGRVRKRSAAITLVLAGGTTLAGCGSPVEQRDAYANRQPSGIVLGAISISAGLLNAACMTY